MAIKWQNRQEKGDNVSRVSQKAACFIFALLRNDRKRKSILSKKKKKKERKELKA